MSTIYPEFIPPSKQALRVFDYLSEERSELNLTKIHEKVFSEGDKFAPVKFNAARIVAAKMSCGKKSGDELSSGEI